jgi:hypothetical protein
MEKRNDQGNEHSIGSVEAISSAIVIDAINSLDEVVRLQKLLVMAHEVFSLPIGFHKDAEDRAILLLTLYLEHSQSFLATAQESLNNLLEVFNR